MQQGKAHSIKGKHGEQVIKKLAVANGNAIPKPLERRDRHAKVIFEAHMVARRGNHHSKAHGGARQHANRPPGDSPLVGPVIKQKQPHDHEKSRAGVFIGPAGDHPSRDRKQQPPPAAGRRPGRLHMHLNGSNAANRRIEPHI